jgi:RHS repeat-associated protein
MKESGTSSFQLIYDANNRIQSPANCNPVAQFCYDAAGDLLKDNNNHVYAFDGEARVKTVDGTAATYTYNPLGNRVRKDVAAGSTEYFFFAGNTISELNPTTSTWTDYAFAGGKRLAKDTSNNGTGAQYYQDDHLGSARIMTDNTGSVISNCTFNAFGEQVLCSPNNASNHYRFTGKERDNEDNLDDFSARYFSSSMGRWLTPDWSARPATVPYASFGDPQSLNLYLYVRNDPVSRADADGHVGHNADWCPLCDELGQAAALAQQNPFGYIRSHAAPTKPDGDLAPPPTTLPPGKNGEANSWVIKPSGKGTRVKWGPKFPVKSPKGGQPSASWDSENGHWDFKPGDGTGTKRFLPDGTEVDHDNNPVNPMRDLPHPEAPPIPHELLADPPPCRLVAGPCTWSPGIYLTPTPGIGGAPSFAPGVSPGFSFGSGWVLAPA